MLKLDLCTLRTIRINVGQCFVLRYDVSGFPTLKFFPKSNKAGEEYDGGQDLADFVAFINEKCGTSRDGKGQLTSKVSS